jgi:hypothetical protein
MKAMKDNGMAAQGANRKNGWELTEQAIDHLSMTAALVLGG